MNRDNLLQQIWRWTIVINMHLHKSIRVMFYSILDIYVFFITCFLFQILICLITHIHLERGHSGNKRREINKHIWLSKCWLREEKAHYWLYENAMVFIWRNLNCAKFGWKWTSGSGEDKFFKFVNLVLLFLYYLPLEKGEAIHLYKVESPSLTDALFYVWLKFAHWFWRRRF